MSAGIQSVEPGSRGWHHLRAVYLLFLHAMAFVWGAHVTIFEDPTTRELAIALVFAIAVVMACRADARIAGRPILHIVQFLMLLTWPVTAPGYLLWARRWWGLLWALVLAATLGLFYVAGSIMVMIVWSLAA
jgi:hypothetical protein